MTTLDNKPLRVAMAGTTDVDTTIPEKFPKAEDCV